MKNNKLTLQKGFTIIEVMIVLAIAGLIMVIVFLAVPQLQRSQRNTARKSVVGRIKTEIDNYASNNNGSVPITAADVTAFNTKYLTGVNINDPKTGSPMNPAIAALTDVPAVGTLDYATTAKCNGETPISAGAANTRSYALWTTLEAGSGTPGYCLDNQ